MSKITFQIQHRYQQMRTGTVRVHGRSMTTPAIIQTGSALTTLTPDELMASGVQAIKQDAMDYWRADSDLGDLHTVLGWARVLVTSSGAEAAYRWAKPRGRKKTGVSFHDPASGQMKFYTPQDAMQVQEKLGADLTEGFARDADYFAPVDDLDAAVSQTAGWLKDQPELAGDLAPVVGGGLRRARQASVDAISKPTAGYSILGVAPTVPIAEQTRLVNEVVGMLDEDGLRYLPTTGDLQQLIALLLCGIDLIDSDLAGKEAGMGNALSGFKRLHLDRKQFADDHQLLATGCTCLTCRAGVSRAAIHHLLITGQPLGQRYLLLHNLFTINQLVGQVRQMIVAQQVPETVREFARHRDQ